MNEQNLWIAVARAVSTKWPQAAVSFVVTMRNGRQNLSLQRSPDCWYPLILMKDRGKKGRHNRLLQVAWILHWPLVAGPLEAHATCFPGPSCPHGRMRCWAQLQKYLQPWGVQSRDLLKEAWAWAPGLVSLGESVRLGPEENIVFTMNRRGPAIKKHNTLGWWLGCPFHEEGWGDSSTGCNLIRQSYLISSFWFQANKLF
jgi:hypothetical protein